MKQLTYTETQGHKPFNWLQALTAPRIDSDTWNDLNRRANTWPTCACGNMCAVIPRKYDSQTGGEGAPEDQKLFDLGMQFAHQIKAKRKAAALKTFHAIEKRSLELLREINKPKAKKLALSIDKMLDDLAQLGYSPAEVRTLLK